MTDFGTIRQLVDIRQAAEMYGLEVNRAGMARCIFHGDRNPSMKLYDDHFHCYACGAHGDVTDLTAQMFGISKTEAADKLCTDFGISDSSSQPTAPKRTRILSERERVQRAFDVLTDYIVMLREFRALYAPISQGELPDPRFTLSLQQLDYTEYLWDELLDSTESERAEFINANISQFRRYYDSLKKFGKLRPTPAETKGRVRCVPPYSLQDNRKQLPAMTETNGRVKCVQPEERTENYGRKAG